MPPSSAAWRANNSAICAFESEATCPRRAAGRLTTLLFRLAAFAAALARRSLAAFFAPATAAFLSAAVAFVYRRPGAALCLFLAQATLLVAFFNVTGFAFLLGRVFLFAASCHICAS